MVFETPPDLNAFEVLFDDSETNDALPPGLVRFAGRLGFPAAPPDRPWIYSNFAQSLDGLVSFGGNRPGGQWISRSRHDRWMMDLLRTHADAVLCGARSLFLETQYGGIPGGPVFRIADPSLLRFRQEGLGRKKLKNIIVTGSGSLNPSDYRIFHSEHVEAWIVTTPDGFHRMGDSRPAQSMICGSGSSVDFGELLRRLRREYDIEYLLCEGGPTLYGHIVREAWMDEKFATIAPQEIGAGIPSDQELTETERQTSTTRPTSFTGPGFSAEAARWYRWISCRKAGDHEFNRYRHVPLVRTQ